MKHPFIPLLILSFNGFCLGQNVPDSLLASFYNTTIQSYLSSNKIPAGKQAVIIHADISHELLSEEIGPFVLKYCDDKRTLLNILPSPFRKNKNKIIYSISHQAFGSDTIDICFDFLQIQKISRRRIELIRQCRFGDPYPDGRFVWDATLNQWQFTSGIQLRNNKKE